MTLGGVGEAAYAHIFPVRSIEYGRKLPIVDEVVWHFFPSARSNRVGPPTPALLDELKLRRVKAKIYLP